MLTEISASGEPVTLAEAKDELRIKHNEFDRLIVRNLTRAIRYVEQRAQITLRTTVQRKLSLPGWPTYTGDIECDTRFPSSSYQISSPILLTNPIWASTDSVTYYDVDDTEQTVLAANYNTRGSDTSPAQLDFDEYYVFPSLRVREDAVNITYTTGTATPDPVGIMAALLMLKFTVDGDENMRKEADNLIMSLRNQSYGGQ